MKSIFSLLSFVMLMWGLGSYGADTSTLDNFYGRYHARVSSLEQRGNYFQRPEKMYAMLLIEYKENDKGLFVDIGVDFCKEGINFYDLKKIPLRKMTEFFTTDKVILESANGIEERIGFQLISTFDIRKNERLKNVDTFLPLTDQISPKAAIVFQFKFINKKLSNCRIQIIDPKTRQLIGLVEMKDIIKLEAKSSWDDF